MDERPPRMITMRKLTLTAPLELIDALCGALFEAGASGLQEEAADLVIYAETRGAEEKLRAAVARFEQLARALDPEVRVKVQTEEVAETWQSAWLNALEAVEVVSPWVLRPTTRAPAPVGETTLWYQPLASFGDGSHPTTQLAADALLAALSTFPAALSPRVFDVGAGNGVLSMLACAQAVREGRPLPAIVAVDTDTVAVDSMKKNWALNGLPPADVRLGSVQDVQGDHDVVVANITADVLRHLMPGLTRSLAPGGTLILTGLLNSDEDELLQLLQDLGLCRESRTERDGWVRISARHAT